MFRAISAKNVEMVEFISNYPGVEKFILEDGTNHCVTEYVDEYMFLDTPAYQEALLQWMSSQNKK